MNTLVSSSPYSRAGAVAPLSAIVLLALPVHVPLTLMQLPTTFSAALVINAVPYFYRWLVRPSLGDLLKGLAVTAAAAAAHHVTLLFGAVLFFLPVLWLGIVDRERQDAEASTFGAFSRAVIFGALSLAVVGIVLLPFWVQLYHYPITQMPIPHGSRDNYILNPASGMNFWIVPMGALILALPWIFFRGGSDRRLRPLFLGWFLTALLGLGGTTPVAPVLLAFRNAFNVLTFERFTFWATLMALPIVGLVAADFIE